MSLSSVKIQISGCVETTQISGCGEIIQISGSALTILISDCSEILHCAGMPQRYCCDESIQISHWPQTVKI